MNTLTTFSGTDVTSQIYDVGSVIPLLPFQICTALVFALAIISALARTIMRTITRRPLYWDDFFLGIGVAALVTMTGLIHRNIYYLYLLSALTKSPELSAKVPFSDISYLLNFALPEASASAGVGWTVIFCVKASFLIISKQIIQRLPWLKVYFWFVAVFTGLSWATLVCSPFIQCPHFGFDVAKCGGPNQQTLYSAMNGLIAGLDILTDIMVASIPVIILWRSQMERKQKFIVGPFLSVSLIMIIFSSIRVSKTQRARGIDIIWLVFWQYLEAGIAVTVTSITTMRTVFTARKAWKSQQSNSKSYAIATNKSKASAKVMEIFGEGEEESHLMVDPTLPSRIMLHGTWGVSYSRGGNSAEELDEQTGKAA